MIESWKYMSQDGLSSMRNLISTSNICNGERLLECKADNNRAVCGSMSPQRFSTCRWKLQWEVPLNCRRRAVDDPWITLSDESLCSSCFNGGAKLCTELQHCSTALRRNIHWWSTGQRKFLYSRRDRIVNATDTVPEKSANPWNLVPYTLPHTLQRMRAGRIWTHTLMIYWGWTEDALITLAACVTYIVGRMYI